MESELVQELIFQLSRIAIALEKQSPKTDAADLGFRSVDYAVPVKIGRTKLDEALWSSYDHETRSRVDIHETQLFGYLKGLSIRTENTTEGPRDRLCLDIHADKKYRVSAGIDLGDFSRTTIAAKNLLMDLAHLRPDQIRTSPVLIQVRGSDQKAQIVFPSITLPGMRSPDKNLSTAQFRAFKMQPELISKAQHLVEMAWGADVESSGPPAPPTPGADGAAPTMSRPQTKSPAQQGTFSQRELVLHFGGRKLISQADMIDMIDLALQKIDRKDVQLDNLSPDDYLKFFDLFLKSWAATLRVQGAEEGMEEPLFLTVTELDEAYSRMLGMYENPTAHQRYTGWDTSISTMLEDQPC